MYKLTVYPQRLKTTQVRTYRMVSEQL